MKDYLLEHLSDQLLLSNTDALIARDRENTAVLLAHLAEIDERKLYLAAAYPSMYAWCAHKLQLTPDVALKRLQAARTARMFPAIFPALADGRLHLSAVCLLAPHLNTENAPGLLLAAALKTKAEIALLLAERFPRTELLPLVEALPPIAGAEDGRPLPAQVLGTLPNASEHAPGHVQNPNNFAKVTPTAAQRFALHFSIGQSAHDKLRYAQELFSHQMPPGDLEALFELALDQLIGVGEKRKFGATDRPQRSSRRNKNPRHIANCVKRIVWQRDGGRCTFVSEDGRRCEARTLIEYDHVEEVARGGRATVTGIQLRCRAHNQFTAEQTFGREFMEGKRDESRDRAKRARNSAGPRSAPTAHAERACEQDVTPWLHSLGIRGEDARRAAQVCEAIPEASLEERVKFALSSRAKMISRTFSPAAAAQ